MTEKTIEMLPKRDGEIEAGNHSEDKKTADIREGKESRLTCQPEKSMKIKKHERGGIMHTHDTGWTERAFDREVPDK